MGRRGRTRGLRWLIVLALALAAAASGWAIGQLGVGVPRVRPPAPQWNGGPPPGRLTAQLAPGDPTPRGAS